MFEISALGPSTDPTAAPRAVAGAGEARALSFARVSAAPAPAAEGLGARFEAAVLTPLLTAILPSEDSMVWGGQAGKMWRGLFAEQLADATARSGGLGIAELIDAAVASRTQPQQGDEG